MGIYYRIYWYQLISVWETGSGTISGYQKWVKKSDITTKTIDSGGFSAAVTCAVVSVTEETLESQLRRRSYGSVLKSL